MKALKWSKILFDYFEIQYNKLLFESAAFFIDSRSIYICWGTNEVSFFKNIRKKLSNKTKIEE